MDFPIKQTVPGDAPVIAGLAIQMWNSNTPEGLAEELAECLSQGQKVEFFEANKDICFVKKLGEAS